MEQHYYAIETKESYEDSLKHYGVKGMHWGIRRYQPYTSNPRKGGKTGKFIGSKPKLQKDKKGFIGVAGGAVVGAVAGGAMAAYKLHKQKKQKDEKEKQEKQEEARRKNEEWEKKKAELKKRPINDPTDDEKPYMKSPEKQKEALALAKKDDKFEMNFLEAIQNDYFLSDDNPKNKAIREKEYEKFLQNPMRYMQTHDPIEDPPDSKSGLAKDEKGFIGIPAAAALGAIVGGVRAYNSPAVQQKRIENYIKKANNAKTDEEHDKWNRKAENLGEKVYNKALKKNNGDVEKTREQMVQLSQQQIGRKKKNYRIRSK